MARRRQPRSERHTVSAGTTPRSLIPIGMTTLLPDAAERVRQLEQALFEGFTRWGYREIIPPTFEYLDVLSAGLPADILEKCYKVADWTTGRILVLRPDVTAQIAKIVAMGMAGRQLPLRLSYRSTVFRYEPEHAGREREVFQLGVELIGADDASMDAEILTLLIESLKAVGLSHFKISLGHVGFYQALLAQSGLSEQGRKQAELAVARKDLPKLEHILKTERIPSRQARPILEAPGRYGREEMLQWGRTVAGRNTRLLAPIERLSRVYALLDAAGVKDHLLLDLGEFRGFDYYDGVVFDVFSDNVGCELGGGGRYNHLIGQFGQDLPSTGFALDLDRLFMALGKEGEKWVPETPSVLVVAPHSHFGEAFRASQFLRSHGLVVYQETVPRWDSTRLHKIRTRIRTSGASWAVMVGLSALSSREVGVLAKQARTSRTVRIQDLPTLILNGAHAHV
ncbi:MAG: ATP phosphoribosyltransferase regulatory subunit [Nitrospira sp.]|nr:ATP phosphoribosyltransferase regulatory subunit [Nitrospira sp.]MDE0403695.1 ATP phosphoribosyltransferase regulatory subunit [Nitrospira sp.]